MQASITVTGEYVPDALGDCFAIDTGTHGFYYFDKADFKPELDTNWAAGTLLLADGYVWVVVVTVDPCGYNDQGEEKVYYVYRCNQLDTPPGTVSLRYDRSEFATKYPSHKVLYQVTGEHTK